MYSSAAIFTAVILFVSVDSGLGLNCYQCTSTNSMGCKDPFSSGKQVQAVNCNSNEVTNFYSNYLVNILPSPTTVNARKYCLKLSMAGSTSDTIVRTCVEGPSDNMNKTCTELERGAFNQYASTTRQVIKYCNVCDGDNCNSANGKAVSLALGLLSASVLAYVAY